MEESPYFIRYMYSKIRNLYRFYGTSLVSYALPCGGWTRKQGASLYPFEGGGTVDRLVAVGKQVSGHWLSL
jgi:hypothetical protein